MSREQATHVAFVVERAWLEDLLAVISTGEAARPDMIEATLTRWWTLRNEWVVTATVEFKASDRDAIQAALASAPDVAGGVGVAPVVVRAFALDRLREQSGRLAALVALNAPAIVRAHLATQCAELAAQLSPRAAWAGDPPPAIGTVPDAAGNEVVDLHAFVEQMVRAVALGRRALGSDEPLPAGDASPAGTDPGPQYPGIEWRTYAMSRDAAFWRSPRCALPHVISVPGSSPRVLVLESSGPVTYARAGDACAGSLATELATAAGKLGPNDVAVSFVWLPTDTAGPWRP